MGKRATSLHQKNKSRHSPKTKKRLEIKRATLTALSARRKTKKGARDK